MTKKSLLTERHEDILAVQERMRELVTELGLKTELEPDPDPPSTIDQLAIGLRVVRTNLCLLELDLVDLDFEVNGCETRTREEIEKDIANDLKQDQTSDKDEPTTEYDRMQLERN